MRISRVHIHNFRNFTELEVDGGNTGIPACAGNTGIPACAPVTPEQELKGTSVSQNSQTRTSVSQSSQTGMSVLQNSQTRMSVLRLTGQGVFP